MRDLSSASSTHILYQLPRGEGVSSTLLGQGSCVNVFSVISDLIRFAEI